MPERMVSHYRILECLGGGAMGKVYKAEDTVLNRPVALKFLPADLTEDDEASRRFMREARATSSLDHPNICTTHEISQAKDGSWFIAMTWYQGQTLRKIIKNGPLPPEQALDLARQAALGLSQAHEQGVVHRDIKPANIIVTDQGVVKLLDFGLARLLGQARLTRTGTVMGTAAYMSPEQARGEDVGTSSDIWSLGAVLYEMLSGKSPFEGESDVAVIYSVLNIDPPPLPEPVCRESAICTDIVHNCLARDPKDRYPSASVLADDIEMALGGSKPSYGSKPSRSSVFAPPPPRRWPRVTAAVLALALLVGLAMPRSRDHILSLVPFLSGAEPAGVAVIPFSFTGDSADAAAFGLGLSVTINQRLSALEQHSDRFWVVPSEEIPRRKIKDETAAIICEGVELVISGNGIISGNSITLNMIVYDLRNNRRTTQEFRDFAGNLKTWQSDLVVWLTELVDPELGLDSDLVTGPSITNIPASFLTYQRGLGHLVGDGTAGLNTDDALLYLHRAVESDSSFACAWAEMGRAVWMKYRNTDPEKVLEAEGYLTAAARLDTTAVLPHYYLGNLKASSGDQEAALVQYERALERDPVHSPSLRRLAELHFQAERYAMAEAVDRRAVAARPRYPRAHRNAGVHYYYSTDFPRARKSFQAVIDLTPDDFLGYYLMGSVYFEEEDYKNSEAMFEKALALEEFYAAYENLATLYYYDNRFTDSISMSRKALESDTNNFTAWRTLARAFKFAPGFEDSVRPAFEKAMEILQAELVMDPESAGLMADHASFCAVLGDSEKSLAILEDLETNHPNLDPYNMFSMASTYEELGKRERALDWLEAALEKGISFKKIDRYPELKDLQSHPRYIALRNKYEEK